MVCDCEEFLRQQIALGKIKALAAGTDAPRALAARAFAMLSSCAHCNHAERVSIAFLTTHSHVPAIFFYFHESLGSRMYRVFRSGAVGLKRRSKWKDLEDSRSSVSACARAPSTSI